MTKWKNEIALLKICNVLLKDILKNVLIAIEGQTNAREMKIKQDCNFSKEELFNQKDNKALEWAAKRSCLASVSEYQK